MNFLRKAGIPVNLQSKMLTFRDSKITFKVDGDFLQTMTKQDFKISLSNPQDRTLFIMLKKEMEFSIKQKRRKTSRDLSLIN